MPAQNAFEDLPWAERAKTSHDMLERPKRFELLTPGVWRHATERRHGGVDWRGDRKARLEPLQVSGERVASRHRPHPTREPLLTRRLPWAISTSKTPVKKQEMRNDYNVVPQEGFEPPTPSLRMMCSTD
jgi:hypothetical protein